MYRLLVVDEERRCRDLMKLVDWESFGVSRVAQAHSFSDALDQAINFQPQVVLVAQQLGEWMGYEFIARLRSGGCQALCCLMAAHPDLDDFRMAMRSGCRDVLKRPVEAHALRDFLEWAITKELRDPGPETPAPVAWGGSRDADPVLGENPGSYGRIVNMILTTVRRDYRQPLSLVSIAQRENMSSKYIGRIFLKETGMRFTEYLMAYRMQEARRLILSTGEKIAVVAGMVGYSQLNNFYTHFRHYFGVSPSSLRNVQNGPGYETQRTFEEATV